MTFDMKADTKQLKKSEQAKSQTPKNQHVTATGTAPQEMGGPKGLEPTRYGDWENNGRCSDF